MSSKVSFDTHADAVILREDTNDLVGKLLTYVDATFTDPKQREAQKSIVKQTVYNWFYDLEERANPGMTIMRSTGQYKVPQQ